MYSLVKTESCLQYFWDFIAYYLVVNAMETKTPQFRSLVHREHFDT